MVPGQVDPVDGGLTVSEALLRVIGSGSGVGPGGEPVLAVCLRSGVLSAQGADGVQTEQALKIEIGAVHDIAGAQLGYQQVEDIDIVQFTLGEMDKGVPGTANIKLAISG